MLDLPLTERKDDVRSTGSSLLPGPGESEGFGGDGRDVADAGLTDPSFPEADEPRNGGDPVDSKGGGGWAGPPCCR